jgi:hypothetical protein
LSALPSGSAARSCGRNQTAARTYLTSAIDKFNKNQEKDGVTQVYNMLSVVDEISNTCYYGITSYVSLDATSAFSGDKILQNTLYNAGFMFTNIILLFTTEYWQVTNYSYFVGAYIGDTIIRFFYYDPTTI